MSAYAHSKEGALASTLMNFVALDFETANESHASACALAVVRVRGEVLSTVLDVVLKTSVRDFKFSALHGIDREASCSGVDFADIWPELVAAIRDCGSVVVAHNAKFDRRVLESCARRARVRLPRIRYVCSRNLAESVWGVRPADLASVCKFLDVPLQHHAALSDAAAAARIVIAAEREKLTRLAAEVQS